MKKLLLINGLLILVFIFGFTNIGKGQLLFEENFAYPIGDLLTVHGWTAHSGAGTNSIATTASSISYPGYLSSAIGEEVTLVANGEDVNKAYAPQTAGNVYASFLVNVSAVNATGDYFFHLGQDVIGTAYKARVFVKNDGLGGLAFGITHTGGASNPAVFTPFNYALNTTYLIVIKYTFNSGTTTDDVVSLIINPVIGAPEPAATVTAADPAQSDPTNIGSVALRQGTASNGVALKLDGIRIGLTWNDITTGSAATSITVASPVGGDQWRQGTTHNIVWSATGTNTNVMIEYSDNASAGTPTWSTLNPSIAASTGTWAWSIPANQALSTDCKIRVTDIPQTATGSSGTFSIVPPPTPISTLAALRALTPGTGTVYTYIGQGILTFQQTFRHQKYIQDATAAILIDDNVGKITTAYNVGDAITNITGTIAEFNGMLQFTPESDPGAPASTGNTVIPEVVTLAQLYGTWENYEAELIKVPNVNFTSPTGNFANGIIYPVTDADGTGADFRTTFFDVDYIGSPVPSVTEDLVVIPNSRIDGNHITSRSLADFQYNSSDNVVISEIMYNPPDGGNDTIEFVELYNRGSVDVNLKDWYFSKGITYVFPDITMPANTYYVIARDAVSMQVTFGISCTQWTDGFLDDAGEPIVLKDALGQVTDSVYFLPTAPWPTTPNNGGPSLTLCDPMLDNTLPESWSASTNQVAVNGVGQPIFASPGTGCSSGANLVITEIMYNSPESGTDSLEFIELYNNGNAIDLEGFYFSAGVSLTFPSYSLAAGEYVLVAGNSAAIQNTFGKPSIQWTSGALNNSGEAITLNDMFGTVIDQVTYGVAAPWPAEANGQGPSLSLCDPNTNNALPEYWKASSEFAALNAAGDSIFASPLGGCVNPPTVANFDATPTSIYEGQSVQFHDLSTNNPIAWEWTFTGGTPAASTEQNPLIQYNTYGLYSVTLKATNAYGNNTLTKTDYISVGVDGITTLQSIVSLYPNPTNGKMYITNPTHNLQEIAVLSSIGKEVNYSVSSEDIISLDISGQSKGLYVVKITDKTTQKSQVIKVILK
jgi:PKD repeat protein